MAVFKKFSYGIASWDADYCISDAQMGAGFFNSMNCQNLEAEILGDTLYNVTFNNILTLKFDSSSSVANIKYSFNGGEDVSFGYIQKASLKMMTVICSPTFLYIDFIDYYPRTWSFCIEKIGDDYYIGYYYGTKSFDQLELTKVGTSEVYKHSGIFKYSNYPNYLDYKEEDVLFSSDLIALNDPNCIAISKSTAKQIITFEGDDYYTLSEYSAIKISTQE